MPEYRLPDGKILTVKDNLNSEEKQKLRSQLSEIYPDHYKVSATEEEPDITTGGQIAEFAKGVPRGLGNTALLGLIGASETFDYGEDNALTSGLKGLKDSLNTGVLAADEDYADTMSAKLGEGFGSAAAFLGTAFLSPPTAIGLAVGTGVGTQAELQDQARAEGKEITLGQEFGSKVFGGGVGAAEVLSPFSILRSLKLIKNSAPKDKKQFYVQTIEAAFKQGGIEAAQEATAGVLQDAIANGFYDAELDPYDSMMDDATIGGIVGFVLGGGSSAAHHTVRNSIGLENDLGQAEKFDKQQKEQDEIIRQKIILAAEQGDRVIDPDLVPDPLVGPEPAPVQSEGIEIPVLESFDFVPTDDSNIIVVGKETQQVIGTFANIEQAAKAATEKAKQNRNQFIVGSSEQVTSINGLAGNGTASNIARKLYDPLNTLIDAKVLANFDVRVSDKRQQQAKKEKEIEGIRFDEGRKLAAKMLGYTRQDLELMDQSVIDQLASELTNIQTAYPVDGNTVSPESTLGLFWQSAKKSGVGQKNFYTVKEAKKLLNKSDFNQLMSEKSNIKFKKIEATGEMKPVKRVKNKLDISQKSFDDAFESKNIEVDYKSPAFKYFAETFTGNTNLENMGTGQKEMLMSHIKSLPRFNNKTKLPNYTPRPYTEEQMNGFYNQYQGNRFSNNDIKLAIKNNSNGKDLTPKQVNEFRIDLIDSGRATKVNSRLTMTDDFKIQQARRAESYTNETTSEFIDRLKRTTLLTPEDVDAVANDDAIYKQGVIDSNDVLALPSPEPTQKYSNLLDLMKQRLVDRKMGDIAVAFDKNFKASLNIRQKGNQYFYEPVPKGTDAFFDRPLTKIVLSIEAIDPDGTMSETQLATELVNRLDHESVHALIELGILKQKEFDILLRDAKRLLPKEFQNKLIADYKANVPSITEEGLNEELVAEFVRLSINNPSKLISPKSKTVIDKIINFLTTFGKTIYDAGFTSSRTIIQDIQSGKIGERERGTLRNAQRLRAENERKYGIARPDASQLDESKLNKYANIADFSREQKESLDSKITKINNRIEIEENTLQRDSQYLTNDAYQKESAKIDDLKRKRAKLVEERNNLPPDQEPLFSRAPRDESSGMAADYYAPERGPRASDLLEDVNGDGFSPSDIYQNPQFYTAAPPNARDPEQRTIFRETLAFMGKLRQIKGDPDATITMYRAAPTNELREGDLLTPSKTEAQGYVDASEVTIEEGRKAERARMRQEQIDKEGAVNLNQEKLYNQMDELRDIFGKPAEVTPSQLFTYELKAGDVRWDGNQLERWGYYPSNVVSIDGGTPLFSRINSKELYNEWRKDTNNPKTLEQTQEEFEKYKNSLPSTMMPRWNEAASPIAIRTGFDYQEGIEPVIMTDSPSYSRSDKEIPDKYKDIDETINGDNNTPDETFADTLIDIAETKEEVGSFLSRMRSRIIDEFNIQEKTVLKIGKASAKVRELSSRAISGAIQALRMSKKSRGITSQMMMRGVPVLVDEDGNPVPKNVKGFGGTKVIDFKHGGFVKIIGQLHTTEFGVDLMRLFKMFAIGQRGTRLNEQGIEVVLTPEQLELAKEIGQDFPIIETVYKQYQEYNNAILDYAVQTGILSEEITINQLIENITSSTKKITEKQLQKLRAEAKENGFTNEQFRQELLTLANDTNLNLPEGKKIDIRGTAKIWRDNSDYYPFYRKMADNNIQGPAVAGGFLSGNPLGIEIKGSKKAIEPEPLEVMARNMQSIISAAMKNEGLSRLMSVYEEGGLAQKILPKDQKEARNMGSDVMSVFENGERVYYQIADPIFTYGLQALGMTQDASGFMKAIGLPSNILREAITRDPGFIVKNMLRDTLSASVTSGANFIPIVATFKGFAADLSELERFGIIGGYDAANDRQDIVKKINKIKREQGLDVYDEEGNFAINQVVKLWDLAGGLTTRSDGATRKAVADSILELTGDQVEAAYQGLEIINFDRRGFDPIVRIVTTAIPFLNARFQGLDVLYRSGTGQYSSKISEITKNTTPDEVAKSIILTTAFRGGLLTLATGLYYALSGDDERYKEERQSVRDDNWLIPMPNNAPPVKFPIPFEVGFIFKTVPERILDYAMTELDNPNYGNTTGKQLEESITRGITTTLKLDPFAWQVIKPITEVMSNKSSFTGNPIVPPFMESGLDPQEQYTINTSSFAVALGRATNTSPIKIDYILKGYTGTLGTYVLNMADIGVRQATGREYVAPYLTQLPIVKSIFASPIGGGLQEQYYEMRTYSNMVTQTINKLEKDGRVDELLAFMQSHKGAVSTRNEILRIDKYMKKYRENKQQIQLSDLSPKEKREIIEQLDQERNLRLSIVPLLVKATDQSAYLSGLLKN